MTDKEVNPDGSEEIEKITPMDVELYHMIRWKRILEASSKAIAGDGVEND